MDKTIRIARAATLGIGLAALASRVDAVPYDPNLGYFQLQDPVTYETVCETGLGACDVPAGDYVLIDFTVSPPSRTPVTVGGDGGTPLNPSSFVRVDEGCDFERNALTSTNGPGTRFAEDASCLATCPASAPRVYGVLRCEAGAGQVRDQTELLEVRFGTSFSDDGGPESTRCRTDEADRFVEPTPVGPGNYVRVSIMCGPR